MAFDPISGFGAIIDAAFAVVENFASVAITYRRGSLSATGTAVIGRNSFEEMDDGGQISVKIDGLELIVDREFPDFGDGWREPQSGDTIEFVDPRGVTRKLEVLPPLGTDPAWRFTDGTQARIRIHTKFVEVLA